MNNSRFIKIIEVLRNKLHGKRSRKMHCFDCGYSWEAEEPYSYCPACGGSAIK